MSGWFNVPNRGQQLAKNSARGRASEARVLDDLGLEKNTQKVTWVEGNSIPDALTDSLSVEIKDAKNVSLTRQLRIQTEAARALWATFEVAGLAYDIYGTAATFADECSTTTEKVVAGIGLVLSVGFPIKGVSSLLKNVPKGVRELTTQQQKAIRFLEKQIAQHQKEAQDFKDNPTIRPGMENLPKEVIQKQQQIRIQHLQKKINTFKNNIEKSSEERLIHDQRVFKWSSFTRDRHGLRSQGAGN